MCCAACQFHRSNATSSIMRQLAMVSAFCGAVKACSTHPTNEVGTLWKAHRFDQPSDVHRSNHIQPLPSPICNGTLNASFSFLNPAHDAPDAPHSSFWHKWIVPYLQSSQLLGGSVSKRLRRMQLFLGTSRLWQVQTLSFYASTFGIGGLVPLS